MKKVTKRCLKANALCVLLLSLVISCKKDKDTTDKEPKISFDGHWVMNSDTTRYIDVSVINDSTVEITFPQKIDVPPNKQGSITILYKTVFSNDTIYCNSGNIYPGCFFVNKKTFHLGYIAEWRQGLELGMIKEITKTKK